MRLIKTYLFKRKGLVVALNVTLPYAHTHAHTHTHCAIRYMVRHGRREALTYSSYSSYINAKKRKTKRSVQIINVRWRVQLLRPPHWMFHTYQSIINYTFTIVYIIMLLSRFNLKAGMPISYNPLLNVTVVLWGFKAGELWPLNKYKHK